MAGTSSGEAEGLRFRRLHPRDLEGRFDELQDLRLGFYRRVFQSGELPENMRRSDREVRHYVGRTTLSNWSNPNAAVGTVALNGQRRRRPQVVAAFDDRTNEIVGFMYAAENTSSGIERKALNHGVPAVVTAPIGLLERVPKWLGTSKHYVWGNEYVHDGSRPGIVPVFGALSLEAYEGRRAEFPVTWYPWQEEVGLKNEIMSWGYRWDGGEPRDIVGDEGFGINSRATTQERWTAPSAGEAHARIIQLPGVTEALAQARDSMAA